MALRKREYTDQETVITGKNLNDIQDAIIALEDGLFTVDNDKSGEVITITDASNRSFLHLNIYGKTTQAGIPTPDAPVDLVSAGGGGSITVNVTGENDSRGMSISTPNGLPGIPVDSGGNYTDSNGQQWICDEIDLGVGVYRKRVRTIVLNGLGTVPWKSLGSVGGSYRFTFTLADIAPKTKLICDCFSYQGEIPTSGVEGIYAHGNANTPSILIAQNRIADGDVSTLKAYLGENPIEVIYQLTAPIETPLPNDELDAYAALHTYKDSTTVSNDAGAYMELEYIMDAKKYIDRLIGTGGSGGGSSAWLSSVILRASAWTGADSLYSQVVTIDGITEYSKVDLLPSVEQLAIFHNKDVAFVTENEDGVVTVYAIGDKPTIDYTMQVSITEVVA